MKSFAFGRVVAKEIGINILKKAITATAKNLKIELKKRQEVRKDSGFDIEKNVMMRQKFAFNPRGLTELFNAIHAESKERTELKLKEVINLVKSVDIFHNMNFNDAEFYSIAKVI